MTTLIGKYGKNYKSLLRLAVPIIIGQLGAIITGLADTIMVGQHSTDELAASSFVNNVLNTFIIFGTGFSFALTPLVGENLAGVPDRFRILCTASGYPCQKENENLNLKDYEELQTYSGNYTGIVFF